MNNDLIIQKNTLSKNIDFDTNLKSILDWEDKNTKILKKSFGILKGLLKKSPVAHQRQLRKEWERK